VLRFLVVWVWWCLSAVMPPRGVLKLENGQKGKAEINPTNTTRNDVDLMDLSE